ncbi:2C-methyl-D-erythritol 2,4-cyclodiphosphate synthase [Chondrus crispus]|uniref:2-C-methyl-D-erythritol 2,4-cyclodiphosphate synthase n=1 Tax=Chondrus crispus TaxID=2769 RepID=R7QC45_CHOCR|nr:2C-methyl-D-erythritol 2,4-cyclodiphosphate synthase [Chondrus crispus]CDF36072.1 2C-methyl-D-erythritol 2,4-cyclodiphosphate synthase [Chondrus crispus]|eukprot:XP_005715891.1 2C-methyl-D-erythritol 2,4-cyclodiphosphate synthase [Chondrus crispus]
MNSLPTTLATNRPCESNFHKAEHAEKISTGLGARKMMRPAFVNFTTHRLPKASQQIRRVACSTSRPQVVAVSDMRIGHGFDLHRLEPGLPLILGGVALEHDRGCAGHSDGDAVYHCVVDAVLGALSLPDIGQLFPDTDSRFKDCESHVFMTAAYERMQKKGFKIGNIDVTIILERPKLSPHKALIRQNIADLLHVDIENVNVKAKTHEKVDAIGENRAVSVHAVTLLVSDHETAAPAAAEVIAEASAGKAVTERLLGLVGDRTKAIQNVTQNGNRTKLFSKGRQKIAQKVGEEAVEVVIDATSDNIEGVIKESADLLYHLNVLWADVGVKPDDVWAELESREGTSGIKEKASRPV